MTREMEMDCRRFEAMKERAIDFGICNIFSVGENMKSSVGHRIDCYINLSSTKYTEMCMWLSFQRISFLKEKLQLIEDFP